MKEKCKGKSVSLKGIVGTVVVGHLNLLAVERGLGLPTTWLRLPG